VRNGPLSPALSSDFDRAEEGACFSTKLALWCPDEESPWGQRLKILWTRLGRKTIKIPSGLSFAHARGIIPFSRRETNRQRELWPSVFSTSNSTTTTPLLPTSVFARLLDGVSKPNALRVVIRPNRVAEWSLIINDANAPMAYARRILIRDRQRAYHDFLNIKGRSHNKTLATRLLVNAVRVYQSLGIQRVDLTAGLSAGGAVWPKMGFRPINTVEWQKTHSRIRKNLQELPDESNKRFSKVYPAQLKTMVEESLADENPQSIWNVSDLDRPRVIQIPGWSYGLGGYLLRGTRWRGTLDLTNGSSAFKRFRDYVNRKLGPGSL